MSSNKIRPEHALNTQIATVRIVQRQNEAAWTTRESWPVKAWLIGQWLFGCQARTCWSQSFSPSGRRWAAGYIIRLKLFVILQGCGFCYVSMYLCSMNQVSKPLKCQKGIKKQTRQESKNNDTHKLPNAWSRIITSVYISITTSRKRDMSQEYYNLQQLQI